MPSYVLDNKVHEAVAMDGLPRITTDLGGTNTKHVVFLNDREFVESMLLSDWNKLPPKDPTDKEISDAITAKQMRLQKDSNDRIALRQYVISTAQGVVGVPFDQLSALQLRAVVGLLLHRIGALDTTGSIRPLDEWVK